MHRFHLIEDAAAILVGHGVYRQARVYRRDRDLYAAHGGGFVRLYRDGTSHPALRCVGIELPDEAVIYDLLGHATIASKP